MTDKTFFTATQRRTIEAAMARIIPSDDTPGATEAHTIDFVDRYLSGVDYIYAKPDGSGFEKLEGKSREAWEQRIATVRDRYIDGIKRLDSLAQQHHDRAFAELSTSEQDTVLSSIDPQAQTEADPTTDERDATGMTLYGAPSEPALQQTNAEVDLDFLPLLILHTRQGFYADPIYGGNHNRVGWEVIGFPGPKSLAEVHTGQFSSLDHFATDLEHCCGKEST